MGNLGSNMKDETAHSRTLSSPEIEGVAKLIKSGEITKIVMMVGEPHMRPEQASVS